MVLNILNYKDLFEGFCSRLSVRTFKIDSFKYFLLENISDLSEKKGSCKKVAKQF